MADRFPLIANSSSNQIQEVPAGDRLDLTGTDLINVNTAGVVTATQGFSGNITGVAATFSGNMQVGGVLTYEDVANVDSVGIITARAGVAVLGAGVTVTGIATFHNGADFNAVLIENVNIVANKLSAAPNINLDNGMVHYYTTNETTTANPNVFSTVGINTELATGETISVSVLSKPNNAGYFPRFSIDDKLTGITTYWNGGDAPSSAESSGVDVNVYQIIKTGDATFDVLANTSNFA
tara:strand:- start:43 stop:756 length:714 start_codon:yes stop_codon:yes gene_type:complete